MNTEPVRLVALLNAAVAATIAVLALVLDWSADLTAGLTAALAAWVLVGGEFARSKVTPVDVAVPRVVPVDDDR